MNRYKEIKTLGKGSFGRAVLVQEIASGQQYVIKVIQISAMKPQEREDALQEAKILEKLDHPNIIAYKESFADQRYLYIVMEYANGGDLHDAIKAQKQKGQLFDEEQIWDIFLQCCLAVKHIHDRRILQRDLKTQNVFISLVNGRRIIKIGDFGVSKILSSTMECARTAIGTPYYLSPELCNNQGYNNKSDIWALGCILYELCTLNHTFEAANMKMLIVKILEGRYTPISSRYSEQMRSVIAAMLQKDPKKRPSINNLLRYPFLQEKIKKLLPNETFTDEFAHTVFHGRGDLLSGFEDENPPQDQFLQQREAKPVAGAQPFPSNVKPQNAFKRGEDKPAAAVEHVPSAETLANKFSELDNMVNMQRQQAAQAAQAQQPRSAYPSNVPTPVSQPTPSNPTPANPQPTPKNAAPAPAPAQAVGGMFAYNPPPQFAYPSNVAQPVSVPTEHQKQAQRQMAPMSDRDKIRLLKEKDLRERRDRAMQLQIQHAEKVAAQQKERQERIQRLNQQYDEQMEQKRQKVVVDQEQEADAMKQKASEEKQRLKEIEEQAKAARQAEINARVKAQQEKQNADREKMREFIRQKQSEKQAVEDLPAQIQVRQEIIASPSVQDESSDFGDKPDEALQKANAQESDADRLRQMLTDQNSKDSLCYRMENLRAYLEKQLGFDNFFSVYRAISDANERESEDYDQNLVEHALGEEKMGYLNVIVQLIVVEQRFNEAQ